MTNVEKWIWQTDSTVAKPSVSEIWDAIGGKAHLYKTAEKNDGTIVKVLNVLSPGTFLIESSEFGREAYGCQELRSYVL